MVIYPEKWRVIVRDLFGKVVKWIDVFMQDGVVSLQILNNGICLSCFPFYIGQPTSSQGHIMGNRVGNVALCLIFHYHSPVPTVGKERVQLLEDTLGTNSVEERPHKARCKVAASSRRIARPVGLNDLRCRTEP